MGGAEKLKILHINPEVGWGGGEAQVLGLLNYLSLWGHRNHLLCHPEGRLFREAQKKAIPTSSIRVRNDLDPRPIFSLGRRVRQENYDIVHFHTKRAHALSLWPLRVHSRSKYVVTRRMDYPLKKNWYNNYLYNRKMDGVIAISQTIADVLAAGGVNREKIRVIHSGVDVVRFRRAEPAPRQSDRPVIGTVAVLEERKGHRVLLEAAAILKGQGCRLAYRFAGEGSERRHLEEAVSKLGLQEEVAFLGFVSDIPAFLGAVDVFALPSIYEGLGVAVLEAMAAGKPVVASSVGGIPELVEDQITGILVPPKDAQALAKAIAQLVSRETAARKMGTRASERVQDHFTLEKMAKKNEEYYYELVYRGANEACGMEGVRG